MAGSGIVSSFSILKDELLNKKNVHVHHTLINANRTYKDINFHKEIKELAREHPDRLNLIDLITRENNPQQYGPTFFKGRPTVWFNSRQYKRPIQSPGFCLRSRYYALAKNQRELQLTPGFLDSVKEIITKLGVEKKRFKYEDYG